MQLFLWKKDPEAEKDSRETVKWRLTVDGPPRWPPWLTRLKALCCQDRLMQHTLCAIPALSALAGKIQLPLITSDREHRSDWHRWPHCRTHTHKINTAESKIRHTHTISPTRLSLKAPQPVTLTYYDKLKQKIDLLKLTIWPWQNCLIGLFSDLSPLVLHIREKFETWTVCKDSLVFGIRCYLRLQCHANSALASVAVFTTAILFCLFPRKIKKFCLLDKKTLNNLWCFLVPCPRSTK